MSFKPLTDPQSSLLLSFKNINCKTSNWNKLLPDVSDVLGCQMKKQVCLHHHGIKSLFRLIQIKTFTSFINFRILLITSILCFHFFLMSFFPFLSSFEKQKWNITIQASLTKQLECTGKENENFLISKIYCHRLLIFYCFFVRIMVRYHLMFQKIFRKQSIIWAFWLTYFAVTASHSAGSFAKYFTETLRGNDTKVVYIIKTAIHTTKNNN